MNILSLRSTAERWLKDGETGYGIDAVARAFLELTRGVTRTTETNKPMKSVHINSFVRRQTAKSGYSHWTFSDAELLLRIYANLSKAKPGYRDGVILVPIDPKECYSSTVLLKEGSILVGEYKARKEGEEPRKSTYSASGQKMPAKRVDVVLYSHKALLEGKENETDADYEVISVNASPDEEEQPIPTGALIANHLQLSGGTATNMTDTEFVALLRKSVLYWKDKSQVAPDNLKQIFALI